MVLLLALVKTNAAAAYGVNAVFASALDLRILASMPQEVQRAAFMV